MSIESQSNQYQSKMQDANHIEIIKPNFDSASVFALVFLSLCVVSAVLIGIFPLTASIATIFLFAGVHNFFEFRYFLARMPVRWGKSKLFYSVGIGGTLALTSVYLSIFFTSGWLWSPQTSAIFSATWNTIFLLWVALLFYLRGKQKPHTDWLWAFPAAFALASLAWAFPGYFALGLVFLHPFVALWFFDRQLRRTKREWQKGFRLAMLGVGLIVGIMWLTLANSTNLTNDTALHQIITQHAGSEILPGISSHLLVATHVFLETIHYSVWIILLPLIDKKAIPWRFDKIPLITNKQGFPKLITAMCGFSLFAVVVLWIGFSFDYTTTRDIYFAFAIAHVLAEFPFLVKML